MAKSPGSAEAATPFVASEVTAQGSLGADGRLLIPAVVREAAGIERGEKVVLRVKDGRITVSGLRADWRRVQAIAAQLKQPGERVVDEFLAEKRAEAARE